MDENLKNQYTALPADIKRAIESSDVAQKIQDIGRKYSLHVDQVGALEEEITAVMTGAIHPDEFIDAIEEKLDIDTDKAIAITTEVNLDIFQSIRQSLMSLHGSDQPAAAPIQPPSDIEAAERKDILAEIENPTPTIHPISIADQTIPGAAPAKEVVTDLVAGKLQGTVTIPGQKATIPAAAPAPKPKTYAADPYREPIQ